MSYIGSIAAAVQIVEMALDRYAPALYNTLGVFLPLIAVNCAILGASLFMVERDYNLAESAVFGFGSGLGWALAILALASTRERMRYSNVPARPARLGDDLPLDRAPGHRLPRLLGHSTLGRMDLMTTIGLGVLMFTAVIVSLVGVVLLAKRSLVQSGDATITINDNPDLTMKIQSVVARCSMPLAAEGIFVPSACGGKGSCGVCKVDVSRGRRRHAAHRDRAHVSRGEAREGCRLSCQVKVKGDMALHMPPEIFDVKRWTCKVRSNHNVATFIKELVLELPEGESVPFKAGGYIQIECPLHT